MAEIHISLDRQRLTMEDALALTEQPLNMRSVLQVISQHVISPTGDAVPPDEAFKMLAKLQYDEGVALMKDFSEQVSQMLNKKP